MSIIERDQQHSHVNVQLNEELLPPQEQQTGFKCDKRMIAKLAVCLLVMVVITRSTSSCKPYGVRLFYGDVLRHPQSSDFAYVYFDTKNECDDSYIHLYTLKEEKYIECHTKKVQGSQDMDDYTTYVHQCPLKGVIFDETFRYTAVSSDDTRFFEENSSQEYQTSLKDPRPIDKQFTFIVLGDWGPIEKKQYTNIMPYLQTEIEARKADAIIILGDVAYDLDYSNGAQYEAFMRQMSLVACKIPVILVPGNHEHLSKDDQKLMKGGFKLYKLDKKMACGLNIGNTFLTIFDPYDVVVDQKQRVNTLKTLKHELKKSKKSDRFLITTSHYPLTCSAKSHCPKNFKKLKKHFQLLLKYGASFYMAGHAHAYQRLYPYYGDKKFRQFQPPYESGQGYMVAMVEGTAGNDYNIVTEIDQKRDATAKYLVGETGFAVMESKAEHITFEHYSCQAKSYFDHMLLKKSKEQYHQDQSQQSQSDSSEEQD